jgi:hypothetical protein
MPDYPEMYRKLLGAQADAIDGLRIITENLTRAHQLVEEMYIDADPPDIVVLNHEDARPEDPPDSTITKGGKR